MANRKVGAGGESPATKLLSASGVRFTVHAFEVADRSRDGRGRDVSFGAEAAAAIGVDPAAVYKTLMAEVDGGLWVAVVPVSGMLDLKALASAAGGKRATMAEVAAAERASGYVAGGISPLGQRRTHPTVIDSAVLDLATVFVSGGRRGLDIELAPADLIRLTSARTAPISR